MGKVTMLALLYCNVNLNLDGIILFKKDWVSVEEYRCIMCPGCIQIVENVCGGIEEL